MENKWEEIFNYLLKGSYPAELNKGQKQSLRKYSSKFRIHDGELLFGSHRRVVKTKEEAMKLFKEFHASPIGGHTGTLKTRAAMCSRFYWYGMTVDIDKWISECDQCQRVGPPLNAVKTLDCIKVSAVWELIGIDLTGPLQKTSTGYQYIMTATDYFSKWVEAFPQKTKSALEVAKNLCTLIYRHGCPKRILSDQGREFVNQINSTLCELLSIERSVTAAYHPQTNGLDEKTNDNIKRALKKLVNDQQDDWDQYLDASLFSLRSKIHTTTKFSPFLLMYGREARFPSEVPVGLPLSTIILPEDCSEFLRDSQRMQESTRVKVDENIARSQKKMTEAFAKRVQKKYRNVEFKEGDEVLLLNMRKRSRKGGRMEADYTGTYTIKEISGKTATLQTPQVQKLWSSKDTGQVEAVVGSHKIYDTSFRTLSGHYWLPDEIIDAYLHCIMKLAKIPVHCLDAVLGSSVFHRGHFRVVQNMKLPTASTWICPVNVGGHWILVIVKMDEKSLFVIDPFGNENMYQRKILRNWRNFWKARNVTQGLWTIQTAKHNLQQDGSSCGVLILMFAELILQGRSICVAQTDTEEVSAARVKIAATLLECKDGVEDLCVSCNMLQYDADEDFTEMVQCDVCSRWTHTECNPATLASEHFKCKKCVLNA